MGRIEMVNRPRTVPVFFYHVNKIVDLFVIEMMPVLHNFITVDPETFLADPKHIEIVFEMCKAVSLRFILSMMPSHLFILKNYQSLDR